MKKIKNFDWICSILWLLILWQWISFLNIWGAWSLWTHLVWPRYYCVCLCVCACMCVCNRFQLDLTKHPERASVTDRLQGRCVRHWFRPAPGLIRAADESKPSDVRSGATIKRHRHRFAACMAGNRHAEHERAKQGRQAKLSKGRGTSWCDGRNNPPWLNFLTEAKQQQGEMSLKKTRYSKNPTHKRAIYSEVGNKVVINSVWPTWLAVTVWPLFYIWDHAEVLFVS